MQGREPLKIAVRRLTDAGGRGLTVDYYITVDEMDTGRFFCESYGLLARVRESGEECAVRNITCLAHRIEELGSLVVAGGVTPATLEDVVSDWL